LYFVREAHGLQNTKIKVQSSNKFSGDFVDRVTPVPIPNTEVKPVGADGTARETAWESRKSPGLFKKARESVTVLAGFYYLRLIVAIEEVD
jgi:hypothetical protein